MSPGFPVGADQATDCSSVHSSSASDGDGTFCTEEDFVSAVARAAEMSGLTVVGTTVCDPNQKSSRWIDMYCCLGLKKYLVFRAT